MVGINAPFFFDAFIPSQERDRSPLPLARICGLLVVHSARETCLPRFLGQNSVRSANEKEKKIFKLDKIKFRFGDSFLG